MHIYSFADFNEIWKSFSATSRVPGTVLDSLAADIRQGEAVFQYTIRWCGGRHADGRQVGAALDDPGTRMRGTPQNSKLAGVHSSREDTWASRIYLNGSIVPVCEETCSSDITEERTYSSACPHLCAKILVPHPVWTLSNFLTEIRDPSGFLFLEKK